MTFVAFAFFIATSLNALLRDIRHFDLTTARIVSGIAIEVAILAATAWILRIRGWNFTRLGLAGLPLMLAYMLLYWFTALTIASITPVHGRVDLVEVRWLAPVPLTIAYLLVNSVYEELLVAGYVITALEHDGAAYAITASTLIRFLITSTRGRWPRCRSCRWDCSSAPSIGAAAPSGH